MVGLAAASKMASASTASFFDPFTNGFAKRGWMRRTPCPKDSKLSPRELAVRFTDEQRYFVSEATVYRLLKAHDLITSPAYVVIKAADRFQTIRPNEMWQTDFDYFKIIGWGWMYLSTVHDDYSRYIIAWRLCSTMRAEDVTDTLDMALAASAAITRMFSTGRGCSRTIVRATSRANWQNTSKRKP